MEKKKRKRGVPHVSPVLRDMGIGKVETEIPRSRNYSETWGTPFRSEMAGPLWKCSFVTDTPDRFFLHSNGARETPPYLRCA